MIFEAMSLDFPKRRIGHQLLLKLAVVSNLRVWHRKVLYEIVTSLGQRYSVWPPRCESVSGEALSDEVFEEDPYFPKLEIFQLSDTWTTATKCWNNIFQTFPNPAPQKIF